MSQKMTLIPGQLDLTLLTTFLNNDVTLKLDSDAHANIHASVATVAKVIADHKTVYGINTGFSRLANTRISENDIIDLQRRIVLSHACGCGELLSDEIVRCILILKINSLSLGYSGIRLEVIEALITLLNLKLYPCVPSQGSVGASGDLAPLAHIAAVLLGYGHVRYQGQIICAKEALAIAKLPIMQLQAKEGLALLNGTQVSTAIALIALLKSKQLLHQAIVIGALATDAALGSHVPFDERIAEIRNQQGQIIVAQQFRELLAGSEIKKSHQHCERVQDPYCLRCQPQVLGACYDQINFVETILMREANNVSDNPLVFSEANEILSGGNFHAEPVAMAADNLALAIAEIGSISERRFALLNDANFSGLPMFLVANPGLNSGFMIAQTTAAALASENKALAHPRSVDSIPTGANQEDHVSMATGAALRLHSMLQNSQTVLALELLATCQAIDLRKPLTTSILLQKVVSNVRKEIPFYDQDRFFATDIQKALRMVKDNQL